MPDVEYVSPRTVDTALEFLRQGGNEATLISGGTNVLVELRERRVNPRLIVDISRIQGWNRIASHGSRVHLGPNCTITQLLTFNSFSGATRLLPMAASWFGGPSIRNRATLGGNIADASPAADMTVPLLALDAQLEIRRCGASPRQVPLDGFVEGPRKTALQADEAISAVTVSEEPDAAVAYYKLAARNSLAISIVSVAVLLRFGPGNVCTTARIALGAVSPVPFRAVAAEKVLEGHPVTAKTITEAAVRARREASPISDIRGSARYRAEMIEVLVGRLLEDIAGRRNRG